MCADKVHTTGGTRHRRDRTKFLQLSLKTCHLSSHPRILQTLIPDSQTQIASLRMIAGRVGSCLRLLIAVARCQF